MMKDAEETSRLASVQSCLEGRKTVFVSVSRSFACPWGANLNYPSFSVFFMLSTSLSPSSFSAHFSLFFFFAPFSASSHHFFQCGSCLHGLHLSSLQVSVWAYCWRCVVVLHPYHHFFLHSQPGCFPDGGKNGIAHRERRRPGQADRDSLRDAGLRLH